MKVESEALFENGEIGTAIFEAIEIKGQIWLVLDMGQTTAKGLDRPPILFHPNQQELLLFSERGLDYRHVGKAIPVEQYLQLPQERQGFFRIG